MPETSMNEHDRPPARQYDVGPTGKVSHVQAIPQALAMQEAAHEQLGPCIASLNGSHHSRPRFGVDDVGHEAVAECEKQTRALRSDVTARTGPTGEPEQGVKLALTSACG